MASFSSSRLGDGEFALVQDYIAHVIDEVLEMGLRPEIEHNFDLFASIRGGVADKWVYPCYDPRLSDTDHDGLWVRAVDRHGQTVATSAARIFETEDFYDLMRSERLWFRAPDHAAPWRCPVECTIPVFGGIVGHAGGTWVHPEWRQRGLSSLMPKFARALMLRNHDIDHETGLVFEGLALHGLPRKSYGYMRVAKVVDGFFPPTGKPERVYLCHITRGEALQQIREVLEPALVTAQVA
jgi:hypothetical protein